MKTIFCSEPGSAGLLKDLYNRPDCPKEIEEAVSVIVDEVRRGGDQA